MIKQPRILFFDIETSGIVATTWNLYPESISHENMLQDWFIISVAWKWLGENTIYSTSVLEDKKRFKKDHTDDLHVIKTFREVLAQADVVVAHNGDKFDIKMFNARLIQHQLPPLPTLVSVDTLKEIKKIAKFTSNRLDFLGKVLIGEGKKETPKGTWLKCMRGDVDAINIMVEYNKGDVEVLEGVYNKLLPYMKSHPHVGVIQGGTRQDCPKCGSVHVIKKQVKVAVGGIKRQQYQCKSCGSYHTLPFKEE